MADLYNLASHYWGGEVISLRATTETGDIFATIPLNFLRDSGVNTWKYVLDLASMLVNRPPGSLSFIELTKGGTVDISTEPSAGEYVYGHTGKNHIRSNSHPCSETNILFAAELQSIGSGAGTISYSAGPYYKNRSKTATTASITSSTHSSHTPTSHTVCMALYIKHTCWHNTIRMPFARLFYVGTLTASSRMMTRSIARLLI
jgi:hypothetical protein